MGVIKAMRNNPVCETPMQERQEPVQENQEQIQKHGAASLVSVQDSTEEEQQLTTTVVHRKRLAVPIQDKALLTLEEASEYTGLGLHKLREISNARSCPFILWNGKKRMFKRIKLLEYLADAYSI